MEENLTSGNELFIINKKTKWINIYLIALTVISIAISFVCFGETNKINPNESDGENLYIVQSGESGEINETFSGDSFIDEELGGVIIEGSENHIDCKSGDSDDMPNYNEVPSFENSRYIDPSKPMVALTFDDGPHPKNTLRLIEIFKENNSRASFFDIGQEMEKYPDIVKAEVENGFDVGGHTYSHVSLNNLSGDKILAEVNKTKEAFKNATGLELKYLRAPYGEANATTRKNIDIPLIHWNVDAEDWKLRNSDKIIEEIRNLEKLDGKIILMHATYDWTVKAIEQLVPELIEKGYQLVTVSELAAAKGKTVLENGRIYYGF